MIELRTLGAVDLHSADGRALSPILRQPKRLMLLAFLALAGAGRFRRRNTILAYFWPDLDEQRARRALRQAIRFLRRSLGEGVVVERGREELGLDATRIRCDAVVCGERLAQGDRAGGLALYTGELLPGMLVADAAPEFQQWLDGERASLRRRAAEAALALSRESSDATGADALAWARRAVELAPDDETMLRQQLIQLEKEGNHLGALRAYEEFAARLATDYGSEPSVETRAVAQGGGAVRVGVPSADAGGGRDRTTRPVAPLRAGRRWPRTAVLGIALAAVIAGAVVLGRRGEVGRTGSRHPRTAVAVLPFQDLSPGGPHAYFAGGLHEELLTQLARVGDLTVMGRTSVMPYAGTTKSLPQIADELGVGSIVEASVQVLGDRLRVTVQLLDAATGRHLWADTYDRTLDDAFAIQSDVARRVVAAVGARLGITERTAIADAPTANAEAYRLYLQGLEYFHRPGLRRRNWEIAQDAYERALALDSTFALAYAALSEVHGWMAWLRYDTSPERLARQREAAERALRLAPGLPQAHVAMGLVQSYGRRDWEAALREYRIALEGLPNDAELWVRIGYAHRRLGNWDEVMAALGKVVALDPRNAQALADLGANTLRGLRRYPEAIELYTRSLALAPDVWWYDLNRGWMWVLWRGRLDSLEAAVDRHPREELGTWRADELLWGRKPDSLLALLRRTPEPVFDDPIRYLPAALYAAWAHQLRGDPASARAAFDSARALLDSAIRLLPGDRRVHGALGLALAGLGRRQEARREARWIQQSRIYREDAYGRALPAEDRAQILAGIGEADAAVDEIERMLVGPTGLSVHMLRLDPRWDPIRNDPQFQALLVKYADPKPVR